MQRRRSQRSSRRSPKSRRSARRSPRRSPKRFPTRRSPRLRTRRTFRAVNDVVTMTGDVSKASGSGVVSNESANRIVVSGVNDTPSFLANELVTFDPHKHGVWKVTSTSDDQNTITVERHVDVGALVNHTSSMNLDAPSQKSPSSIPAGTSTSILPRQVYSELDPADEAELRDLDTSPIQGETRADGDVPSNLGRMVPSASPRKRRRPDSFNEQSI